jgi:hypothetical protein
MLAGRALGEEYGGEHGRMLGELLGGATGAVGGGRLMELLEEKRLRDFMAMRGM